MKIISIFGARPNFMKIAPIAEELKKHPEVEHLLVHTGQHYDEEMSKLFFEDLRIQEPNVNLGVGSGTQAEQTASILVGAEKVLSEEKPDLVLVVGDCNSTIGGALAAAKLKIPVAHIEAGLRSFNWEMPEEINRVVTDHLASYLFTTEKSANENLKKEGVAEEKIFFVGNVMIDTLLKCKEQTNTSKILEELDLKEQEYAVLTLHRPENVDNKENLAGLLSVINEVGENIKIVLPLHPRTKKKIDEFGLQEAIKNIKTTSPLGYLDFMKLVSSAKLVLTDSGGIQEETTILNVPCITLRNETERPVTVEVGSNVIVGRDGEKILAESLKVLNSNVREGKIPELWDGKTAERIVKTLLGEK